MFDIHPREDTFAEQSPCKRKEKSKEAGKETEDEDTATTTTETLYSSRNAYMLLYARRKTKPAANDAEPPGHILEQVGGMNQLFAEEIKLYADMSSELERSFNQYRTN